METLSSSWVDALFARLGVRYGAAFVRQYADIDLEAVKADWGAELAGFRNQPTAIAYALEHMPADKPPNAAQFRALARMAPAPDLPRLAEPIAAMPEKVSTAIDGIADSWVQRKQENPARYCIDRIMAIVERRGGRMSTAQRQMIEACERVA